MTAIGEGLFRDKAKSPHGVQMLGRKFTRLAMKRDNDRGFTTDPQRRKQGGAIDRGNFFRQRGGIF